MTFLAVLTVYTVGVLGGILIEKTLQRFIY